MTEILIAILAFIVGVFAATIFFAALVAKATEREE